MRYQPSGGPGPVAAPRFLGDVDAGAGLQTLLLGQLGEVEPARDGRGARALAVVREGPCWPLAGRWRAFTARHRSQPTPAISTAGCGTSRPRGWRRCCAGVAARSAALP